MDLTAAASCRKCCPPLPPPGWLTGLVADRTLQDGFDRGSQLYCCPPSLLPGWLTGLVADRTLQDGFDCGSQLQELLPPPPPTWVADRSGSRQDTPGRIGP